MIEHLHEYQAHLGRWMYHEIPQQREHELAHILRLFAVARRQTIQRAFPSLL